MLIEFRKWIERVSNAGLLKQVNGADWDLEIGVLTEMNARGKKYTLLFDEIRGYPKGHRILVGSLIDSKRVALALDLPVQTSNLELVRLFRDRLSSDELSRNASDFPPETVSDAPLFENRMTGAQVNLFSFPSPKWHEYDGGRYIGTADCVITKDPDSDWINVGAYRVMVQGERELGVHISGGHHGRVHINKYLKRKEKCPIAISFGHTPLLFAVAGIEVPDGVSEFNYAGALVKERVKVVKGPVTGLPIPADSEIAIEGFIGEETKDEGPFGEFAGYYAGGVAKKPLIKVEAVYYRNNPIILGTAPGRPPYDYSYFRCPLRAALIWDVLEKAGIPDVNGVWCHEAGYTRAFTVVSIKQGYVGHARQAGYIASMCRPGGFAGRYVVVVDEDIDPSNLYDVVWAMCSRTDPATAIDIIRDTWSTPLDPMTEKSEDKLYEEYSGSRALIIACKPFGALIRNKFPRVVESSREIQARVREKWQNIID